MLGTSSATVADFARSRIIVAIREWADPTRLKRSLPIRRTTDQCRAKITIADVPEPPKKPETTPDVVATYCLPSSSYVTTPPPTVPPVLNLYNVFPLLASSTRNLLSRSPVKSTPPDVAVTAATSGVGQCVFSRTLPVVLSIAVSQPLDWSLGSGTTLPP